MKKLCTLDFPPQKGGIQSYVLDIARHELSDGDVVVAAGCAIDDLTDASLKPVSVKRQGNILRLIHQKLPLLSIFFDTLFDRTTTEFIAANVYAAIPLWLTNKIRRIDYSVCTHGGELLALPGASLRGAILRKVLTDATSVRAVSRYTRTLLERGGVTREVIFAPPKIDRPQLIQRKRPDDQSFRILAVARLVPHKGIDVLIRAVASLNDTKLSLTIVGNGPCRKELEALTGSMPSNQISFTGSLDKCELERIYSQTDCLILPSLERSDGVEGFGIVLIEAMARGIPVIASRCGGIPGVLDNGECGILVEPGNIAQLTDAIIRLKADHDYRESIATRGRIHAENNYVR